MNEEDELFHVIKGKLTVEFHDKVVELLPGEILVVPKGVEHKPRAEEETWIMLFEPLALNIRGMLTLKSQNIITQKYNNKTHLNAYSLAASSLASLMAIFASSCAAIFAPPIK